MEGENERKKVTLKQKDKEVDELKKVHFRMIPAESHKIRFNYVIISNLRNIVKMLNNMNVFVFLHVRC